MSGNDKHIDDDINEFDEFEELEVETVTFTDEDGEELECVIIDTVSYNGFNYLLVVNIDDFEDEDAEAGILKEIAADEDSFTYEHIEDDKEFEAVSKLFEENGEDYIIES